MGCDGWTSNPEGFEVGTKLYLERTSLKNCVITLNSGFFGFFNIS